MTGQVADQTPDLEIPQLYLITPPELDLASFPDLLARVLDVTDIACIRLALSTQDESLIARAADACRVVAHERDIALVISDHLILAQSLGLDGVHLSDGMRRVRKAREELGKDAIVGTYCGNTRHDGMAAAENGADYVSFGPVGASTLGDGEQADIDLFSWWSQMIEVPVVAEGLLDTDNIRALAPVTDFIAFGDEIWNSHDPVTQMQHLVKALRA